jgi:hypothetical protein
MVRVTATRTPSALASRTHCSFAWTEPPTCNQCGVQLNRRSDEGDPELTAWIVTDRVLSGETPKLGNVYLCTTCSSDPVKEAARLRRCRKVFVTGDYIA